MQSPPDGGAARIQGTAQVRSRMARRLDIAARKTPGLHQCNMLPAFRKNSLAAKFTHVIGRNAGLTSTSGDSVDNFPRAPWRPVCRNGCCVAMQGPIDAVWIPTVCLARDSTPTSGKPWVQMPPCRTRPMRQCPRHVRTLPNRVCRRAASGVAPKRSA